MGLGFSVLHAVVSALTAHSIRCTAWHACSEVLPHHEAFLLSHMMCRAQEHEVSVYEGVRSLTAYFGEDWDANDPSRVLRVVRDFMDLFGKAHREIEVPVFSHACHGAGKAAACLQGLPLSDKFLKLSACVTSGRTRFNKVSVARNSMRSF